jgi:hypothetical protein
MPPTPPKLPEEHKSELISHAEDAAKKVTHHKKQGIKEPLHFSSIGAGLPHKMKNIINRGGHHFPEGSSVSSSTVPESAISDAVAEDEDTSTGLDGVKESDGEGKKKGEAKKEQQHIGRHGSFSYVHGGAGMHQKMIDRKLNK